LQTEEIGSALAEDIPGILELQEQNLTASGGALAVRFSREWFTAAIAQMPVVVAHKETRVVGYALSSAVSTQSHLPIIQAMLRAYPLPKGAYLYGPICIAAHARGCGLAGRLFAALTLRLPGRQGITFIHRDNGASLRAHAKMGMRQVAAFSHVGEPYLVMVTGASATGKRAPSGGFFGPFAGLAERLLIGGARVVKWRRGGRGPMICC
jgi:L-amino acid N-acyltransferase YncA